MGSDQALSVTFAVMSGPIVTPIARANLARSRPRAVSVAQKLVLCESTDSGVLLKEEAVNRRVLRGVRKRVVPACRASQAL